MAQPDHGWRNEIIELHAFFEAYFLGVIDSLERFERVLSPQFTMVGPHGNSHDRSSVIEAVRAGHGHSDSLVISTTDHRLLARRNGTLVAEYVEHHQLAETSNHRITTAVFEAEPAAPNGVVWLRVHETWAPTNED